MPAWGTERIRGELLKLAIVGSNRSIRRYRWRAPRRERSQSSRTFLRNQIKGIWAADLFVLQTDPRGHQIPRPRPFSYSKSAISEVVYRRLNTAGSQFPAEPRNLGRPTVLFVCRPELNRCLRGA
jgi:hypothetical protein